MKVIDPGHEYELDVYDTDRVNDPSAVAYIVDARLRFVKREGPGYPFNVGHHAGTNCQEVIRVLIDRVQYLQKQIPCDENVVVITKLREALWQFEQRAAERHGRSLSFAAGQKIETLPTCKGCGHVGCEGEHKAQCA